MAALLALTVCLRRAILIIRLVRSLIPLLVPELQRKKKGEAADRSEVEKSEIAPRMKIVTKRRRQNLGAATLYAFDQARRKLLLLRGHWRRREAHEAIEKTFFLGTARRSFWFVCWRKSSCC
jgi:hypothetical protein